MRSMCGISTIWSNRGQPDTRPTQGKARHDRKRQGKTRQDKIGARRHQTELGTSGSMLPIFIADPIALAKPLPSGAGAVMWCASHVAPYPATCLLCFFKAAVGGGRGKRGGVGGGWNTTTNHTASIDIKRTSTVAINHTNTLPCHETEPFSAWLPTFPPRRSPRVVPRTVPRTNYRTVPHTPFPAPFPASYPASSPMSLSPHTTPPGRRFPH